MTEQQPYEVLQRYPGFELRRYPNTLWPKWTSPDRSAWRGTSPSPNWPVSDGGHNQASRKVAMTAPVVQEKDPRSGVFVVGFVMPSDLAADEVPEPLDSSVRTRRVPAQTAAALTFSGRWSRSTYEARTNELLDMLAQAQLTVVGRPRYARFDPPWTPWFLRRNEVVIPVRSPGEA